MNPHLNTWEFSLIETRDNIRSLIPKLFDPSPDFYSGTVGDNAYRALRLNLQQAKELAYFRRLNWVLAKRYDLGRKARLKPFKRQPEPYLTPLGQSQNTGHRYGYSGNQDYGIRGQT